MNAERFSLVASLYLCAAAALALSAGAGATPFTPLPTVAPCPTPGTGCVLPPPPEVPGKEYSNGNGETGIDVGDIDDTSSNATPSLDPEQGLRWDGIGGVVDTTDFSGSRVGSTFPDGTAIDDAEDRQVDALANSGDALYGAVVSDLVWLLFSTDDDGRIYFEDPGSATGGVWATPPSVNSMHVPEDVDGLEVWGPNDADDANRYSLESGSTLGGVDPFGVAVWDTSGGLPAAPLYGTGELAAAIAALLGSDLMQLLQENLDLDAMMTFGLSDIMFSVDPILDPNGATLLDGGEIFVGSGHTGFGSGFTSFGFLSHGGHLWDTAFDVRGTYGTGTENINALEAVAKVPEPWTLGLFGLGLGLAGLVRRRIN